MKTNKIQSAVIPEIFIHYYPNSGWYLAKEGKTDSPLNLVPDEFKRLCIMAEANEVTYPLSDDELLYIEQIALFTGEKKRVVIDNRSLLESTELWCNPSVLEQLACSKIAVYRTTKANASNNKLFN